MIWKVITTVGILIKFLVGIFLEFLVGILIKIKILMIIIVIKIMTKNTFYSLTFIKTSFL